MSKAQSPQVQNPDRLEDREINGFRWWIGAAILFHVLVAGHATLTKSATFDEPVHIFGGLLQSRFGDYRINPEHPPLWKYVAGLATVGMPLAVDLDSPESQTMLGNVHLQERWAIHGLFQSAENDGVQLIDRARMGMLIFGALVVLFVGIWATRLGGQLVGLIAAWLAALDPNLLAHSGLVTNDVACTASLLACFFFAWRLTIEASTANIAAFCLACGIAACIKFTALALPLFLAPIVALRLVDRSQWNSVFLEAKGLLGRLLVVTLTVLLAATTAWAGIWMAYGFRYLPTNDPSLSFNTEFPGELYLNNVLLRERFEAEARGEPPPVSMEVDLSHLQSFCRFANQHRLLPQPFLHGLAYAQAMSTVSHSFLDGNRKIGGSLSYFPKAWLYKTPLATVVLVSFAAAWCVWILFRYRPKIDKAFLYLALPYGMVILTAITYDLNIGLRHLLPAFPLVWIGLGLIAGSILADSSSPHSEQTKRTSKLPQQPVKSASEKGLRSKSRKQESKADNQRVHFPSWMRVIVIVLIGLIALETLSNHPNYIAFFNVLSRGNSQGLDRLSDSNLDWGQDLKILAEWQQQHPDRPLYLSYFGSADPAAYGVQYVNTIPGYFYGSATVRPSFDRPAYLAYSASWLQGAYIQDSELRSEIELLRRRAKPMEVLGGTIYIYELPIVWKE